MSGRYRPGRRAVVRVRVVEPVGRSRVRAVPQGRASRRARGRSSTDLRSLDGHVPVPEVVATWPEDGIVVLAALGGRTVREVLLTGDRAAVDQLPAGDALLALLDRLPAPVHRADRARRPWSAEPRRRPCGPARRGHAGRAGPSRGTALAAGRVVQHGSRRDNPRRPARGTDARRREPGRRHARRRRRRTRPSRPRPGHAARASRGSRRRRPASAGRDRPLARSTPTCVRSRRRPDSTSGGRRPPSLVGLATGPFRVQAPAWRRQVHRRIGLAEAWARQAGA